MGEGALEDVLPPKNQQKSNIYRDGEHYNELTASCQEQRFETILYWETDKCPFTHLVALELLPWALE